MTIGEMRHKIYVRFSIAQSIKRLCYTEDFTDAYKNATEEEQNKVMDWIIKEDNQRLKEWLKGKYKGKTITELQEIGRRMNIKNYKSLPKHVLLGKIDYVNRNRGN